jgi:hypothetical protein
MDVLKLPAAAGVAWIRGGFMLLFTQFLGILMLVMTYGFAIILAGYAASGMAYVANMGGLDDAIVEKSVDLVLAMLAPALTIGFMAACRAVAAGERVGPAFILAGFQVGKKRLLSLLGLGVFQVAALFVVRTLLAGELPPGTPDPDSIEALTGSFDTSTLSDAAAAHFLLVRSAELIARLGVAVVLWYAPMLVAWHGMRSVKSTFYSVAACWRNRAAFVIFGLGWVALWITLFGIIGLGSVLGLGDNAKLLFWPVAPIMFAAMYCSVYVTYASVFVITAPAAAAP